MKSSFIALTVFLGIFAYTHNAEAKPLMYNQKNPTTTNQAATLTTEPATINNSWNGKIEQNDSNSQPATISLDRDPACEKKGIIDYISNPESLFKECANANKPISTEPPEEFKPPRLDSGLSVTVTNF